MEKRRGGPGARRLRPRCRRSPHRLAIGSAARTGSPTTGTARPEPLAGLPPTQAVVSVGRGKSQLITLDASIQRRAAQAERLRGARHVSVPGKRLLDEECLDVFEAHVVELRVAVASGTQRQILNADQVLLRHQRRALDRVVECANVARPGMARQRIQRRRLESSECFPISLGVEGEEMYGEWLNVVGSIPQRRKMNLDRVQPEQQILSET